MKPSTCLYAIFETDEACDSRRGDNNSAAFCDLDIGDQVQVEFQSAESGCTIGCRKISQIYGITLPQISRDCCYVSSTLHR